MNSQDDIIVWGRNKHEHDERLDQVLSKIKESGLKLNKKKCIFGVQSVTFLGHNLSNEGIKPDLSKIKAVNEMPIPKSKVELQRFLGLVNYVGKFIPNLSQITAPLRLLLKKDVEFIMEKPHFDAIDQIKMLITTSPCLAFYDPNLLMLLRPDASSEGLDALLEQLHDEKT